MCTRIAAVVVGVLVALFGVAAPAAHAQGHGQRGCSLQSLAGTWVSFDRGSSSTIDLTSMGVLGPMPGAPLSPPAWNAPGIVPFVNIARVRYTPDGIGEGYFWMFAGSVSATLDPIPVHITVTELDEDCTGKFQYTLANGAKIEERIILFDDGRQYRSVPTSLFAPGIPTLAWIGTGQRISRDGNDREDRDGREDREPFEWRGPHTAGSYLMSCDNLLRTVPYPTKAVADTFLLRMDVDRDGDYTGLLYEKFGMTSIDGRAVSGTVTVNPDWSFASTLAVDGIPGWIEQRGVFFNEGREFYAMGILNPSRTQQNIMYSFCQGTRIGR